MGIKGTVRRSKDSNFIHTNIDTDLIISEGNEYGSIEKPVEIFEIIEHFCLGKRRYRNNYTPLYQSIIFKNRLNVFKLFVSLDYMCLAVTVLYVQDG